MLKKLLVVTLLAVLLGVFPAAAQEDDSQVGEFTVYLPPFSVEFFYADWLVDDTTCRFWGSSFGLMREIGEQMPKAYRLNVVYGGCGVMRTSVFAYDANSEK